MFNVLFLTAVVLIGASSSRSDTALDGRFEAVNRFEANDAAALVDAGRAVLVDVRDADERSLGHVAGDLHVPFTDLDALLDELPNVVPLDKIVISYCSCPAEETSLYASELWVEAGYRAVGVLLGGTDAWAALGRGDIVAERTEADVLGLDLPPVGWIKTNRESDHFRFEPRDGRLVIRGVGDDPDEKAAVMQKIDAVPLRGQTVVFQVELALEEVERGVSIWLRAEDDASVSVGYRGLEPGPLTGTAEPTRYKVSLEVPNTATQLDFGVVIGGAGTVIADDASLTLADGEPVDGPVNLALDG